MLRGAVRSSLLLMVFLSLMVDDADAKSLLRENQKTSDESTSSSSLGTSYYLVRRYRDGLPFFNSVQSSDPNSLAGQVNMTKEEIKLVKMLLKVQKSYPTLNPADQGKVRSIFCDQAIGIIYCSS